MKKSRNCLNLEILFSKFYLTIALLLTSFFPEPLKADQNNTSFIVAGGNFAYPFYTLTFEANGSAVDFESYPLRKGNTYAFKPGNISASHPFNIGASHNVSSPHVTGGPLDQNSANNGQSMTVSIPNDFQGTLSYYCTIHNTMIWQFTIVDPTGGDEQESHPVYFFTSEQIETLTSYEGEPDGNYSIWSNGENSIDLERVEADENGNWVLTEEVLDFFEIDIEAYPTLETILAFIGNPTTLGNATDPHEYGSEQVSMKVYQFTGAQILALTGSEGLPDGNYSLDILEDIYNDGTEDMVDIYPVNLVDGSWEFLDEDDYHEVDAETYPRLVDVLTFLGNPEHIGELSVFGSSSIQENQKVYPLTGAQILALTGSEGLPDGNYSLDILEDIYDDGTEDMVDIYPVNLVDGSWEFLDEDDYHEVDAETYPRLVDVLTFLGNPEHIGEVILGDSSTSGGDVPVVYFLNSDHLLALTGSASAPEGNYSIVEETDETGTTYLTTKPMELVGGTWQEDVNGIPYPLDPAYGTMAQVDSYLADNNIQPVDQNEGGSGEEPHGLPVFALDTVQAQALSATAPGAGNYTFEFGTDPGTGSAFAEMVAAEEVGGEWQRTTEPGTSMPLIYPLESIYPDMDSVNTYLAGQGITDANALGYISDGDAGGDAPVVYFLNSANLLALTGSESAPEGNYSIVEETDETGTTYLTTKPMELVGGTWQEDVNGIPYPLDPAYGTMAQVDSYLADNNIQPLDSNGGGSGGGGDCCPTGPNAKRTLALGETNLGMKVEKVVPSIDTGYVCWEATTTALGVGAGTTYYINNGSSVSQTSILGSVNIMLANGIDDVIDKTITYVHGDGTCYVATASEFDIPLSGSGVPPNTIEFKLVTDDGGGDAPVVYFLNSANLLALTGSESAPEGNYSIAEETDETGTTYLTTKPMELVGGTWQEDVNGIPYPLDPAYGTMAQVDTYLADNNIQPLDSNGGGSGGEPQGLPVFALDATQAGALSATAPGAGNYTFEFYTDPATGAELREMVAAEEVSGEWQRTTDPGTGEPLIYPLESIYPDMNSVSTYLAGQGITDANALGYISDGDAGGDAPVVYFLNSANLLALTGSESAPEGNYSIVEETDETGTTYLTTKPMELVGGTWQEDVNGIPYPLDPAYGTMAQVDSYLADNNIQPVDQNEGGSGEEPHGLPVFALDTVQAQALSATAPGAGNYTFEFGTDPGTGSAFAEMVAAEEVGGEWQRTTEPGTSMPLIYPLESIYPDMDSVNTYLAGQGITDANALGYISDGDAGGDAPVVYFLNSANLLALTGSESAPEGNYSIVEETDETGTTYLTTKPMELVGGTWQEDVNGIPYPLDPAYGTMAQVDSYLADNNIQPLDSNGDDPVDPGTDPNDPVDPGTDHENEGLPVFTLNVSQAETLTDDVVPAGSYALEIFQEQGGFEIRQLVGVIEVDGIWERELQNGQQVIFQISSAHFPTTEAIDTYIDEQGLVPTGFITEDTNPGTDPNDPVDPGTDPNDPVDPGTDPNDPVDPGTDPNDPVDPGTDHENEGLPVFTLNVSQAETLTDDVVPAGSYALEIFQEQGGFEIRQLVGVIEVDGIWERELQNGQQVIFQISSAHFPTTEAIDTYIDEQGLVPTGFITEDTNPGTDPNDPVDPGTDPNDPVDPGTDPNDPVDPGTDPNDPVDPGTDPNDPVDPGTDPNDPVDPGTDPNDPVDPGTDHENEGLPVFTLNVSQAETLTDDVVPAGSYALEIFQEQGGFEIRQLVGVIEVDGIWERELQNGQQVIFQISSAHFPTTEAIDTYIDEQGLVPTGFITEDTSPGTDPNDPVDEELPVFELSSSQIFNLTGVPEQPAGNYAVWDLGNGWVDIEPVDNIDGQWVLTEDEFDFIETDEEQFASLEDVLTFLGFPDPLGFALVDDFIGTDEELPVFELSSSQIFNLTGVPEQPAGNYAVWDLGNGWVDIEPVDNIDGQWVLTEDEFDFIETDEGQFASIEDVLTFLGYPDPLGFALVDDFIGTEEELPVFELSSSQIFNLTGVPEQPAGNYAIWDLGYGWVDIEPVDNIDGQWVLTEDEFDFIETDEGQFASLEDVLTFLGYPDPLGFALVDDFIGTEEELPVFELSSSQIFNLTGVPEQPAGNYAIWDLGYGWVDIEPVDNIDGQWVLTEDEFDFIETDEGQFASIEDVLTFLGYPDPLGFALVDDFIGTEEELPVFELSSSQIFNLTGVPGQPAGNYAIWDLGYGWVDIEPVDNIDGQWVLTEDEFDFIETDEGQFASIEDVLTFLGYPNPLGFAFVDDFIGESDAQRVVQPLVHTEREYSLTAYSIEVNGEILSFGNNDDLIIGFQFSDSIFFENPEEVIVAETSNENVFSTNFELISYSIDLIYFRAFARNSLFESFGVKKKAQIPEVEDIPNETLFPDAVLIEDGWKENWLGVFHEYSNGWMYHLDLGWCFASPDNNGNVWLWINDHGWVWTNGSTWPHLYRNETSSWLYLLIRQSGPAVFFDQMHGSFMHLNK